MTPNAGGSSVSAYWRYNLPCFGGWSSHVPTACVSPVSPGHALHRPRCGTGPWRGMCSSKIQGPSMAYSQALQAELLTRPGASFRRRRRAVFGPNERRRSTGFFLSLIESARGGGNNKPSRIDLAAGAPSPLPHLLPRALQR